MVTLLTQIVLLSFLLCNTYQKTNYNNYYNPNDYQSQSFQCYEGELGHKLTNCWTRYDSRNKCRIKIVNGYLSWYTNSDKYNNIYNTDSGCAPNYSTAEGCEKRNPDWAMYICWCTGTRCNSRANMFRIYKQHSYSLSTLETVLIILCALLLLTLLLCCLANIFWCSKYKHSTQDGSYYSNTPQSSSVTSHQLPNTLNYVHDDSPKPMRHVFSQNVTVTPRTATGTPRTATGTPRTATVV